MRSKGYSWLISVHWSYIGDDHRWSQMVFTPSPPCLRMIPQLKNNHLWPQQVSYYPWISQWHIIDDQWCHDCLTIIGIILSMIISINYQSYHASWLPCGPFISIQQNIYFFEGHPARQMGCPDRLWNRQVRSLRQVGRDGNWSRPGLRRIQHGVVGVVLFTVVVCFPKGKLANSAMKHKRSIDRTIYPRIYPLYKLMKIAQKTHKLQFLSLQKMIVAGFGSWVTILVPAE